MAHFSDAYKSLRSIRYGLPLSTLGGFVLAVVAVSVVALLSLQSLQGQTSSASAVSRTVEAMEGLRAVLSTVQDAETGQRGYLLTGTESYLEPYNLARAALDGQLENVRRLISDSPNQRRRLGELTNLTAQKMTELARTVALRSSGDAAGALDTVRTGRGQAAMGQIRSSVAEMLIEEQNLLDIRQRAALAAGRVALLIAVLGSGILLVLIATSAVLASREYRSRQLQNWLRHGQSGLSEQLQGDQPLHALGARALHFLADFMDAQVGAIYLAEGNGQFRRFATYAIAPDANTEGIRPGDGLLGQAIQEDRAIRVRAVPAGYLAVASGVGRGDPRELLVAPASIDGVVHAVMEFGFFRELRDAEEEFLRRVSEPLGVAVRASKDRTRLEELVEETQRQAEELQTQQEELRVNNEELEEQGRALRESQGQMESQHAELEQINSQLEEQTQFLEHQKDALVRSEALLSERAVELERANQYKSEFLANMSHELRTPLNSALILAKLLADNKERNLTEQQVKFAQTISSSGNELLVLINDVLDLSRIESGKFEMTSAPVIVAREAEALVTMFQPAARQQNLELSLVIEPGVPEQIETDAQRLGQILRNLLSNALKFTKQGEVSLRIYSGAAGTVSFAVRDTGIGIPEHQRDIIFEAFRQADGSIHRQYGGTGLGLSISRSLAHLLGGDIAVQSSAGQGSVFTLTLPLAHAADKGETRTRPVGRESRPARPAAPAGPNVPSVASARHTSGGGTDLTSSTVEDDRDRLTPERRLILVVEDDVPFATILRDLTREMGFQCVVTQSANDGLIAATKFHPSAILLDINLPDHSGLGVLEQLKRNPQTRHIPVHVASVADYTQEALELGAIGYALKPVKREQLEQALERLVAKVSQGMRHVLVVEDDERQRQSITDLLANEDVQITAVPSAGEALRKLQEMTFDCMVMDLKLPDYSGYELLAKMAEQEAVAFPPVIVYTGRALTQDEENELRRFSRSIIVKDARSPERLLDEVTLFLHQVESKLPAAHQLMLKVARDRDAYLENRRILVVEDDVRNIFALSSVLEPKGVTVQIARNGREALEALANSMHSSQQAIDLVLMDIMMPEMDGFTAMREIRRRPEWKKLPIIALTAKAMKDDQEKCLAAGANDYIAKPLDVEKLLSLVRVWMPK